jgi:hypothetical protein
MALGPESTAPGWVAETCGQGLAILPPWLRGPGAPDGLKKACSGADKT